MNKFNNIVFSFNCANCFVLCFFGEMWSQHFKKHCSPPKNRNQTAQELSEHCLQQNNFVPLLHVQIIDCWY